MQDNKEERADALEGGRNIQSLERAARGWWIEKEPRLVVSSVSVFGIRGIEGCGSVRA